MKNRLIRSSLLGGAAAVALGCANPAFSQDMAMPALRLFLEGGYTMAGGSDKTAYVEQFDDTTNGWVPRYIDADDGFKGRIGGQMAIGGGFDARLLYTGLTVDGKHEIDPYPGLTVGAAAPILGANVGINPSDIFNVAFAIYSPPQAADMDIEMHMVDLDIGYNVGLGEGLGLRLFGGLRYANFEQDITHRFRFEAGANFRQLDQSREVSTSGIGPRLGVGVDMPLGDGFSLSAQGGGAVLFGSKTVKNRYEGSASVPLAVSELESTHKEGQTSYSADAELGINYAIPVSTGTRMTVTLGYNIEAMWNVNETRSGSDTFAFMSREVGKENADFVSHGPFLRLGLAF